MKHRIFYFDKSGEKTIVIITHKKEIKNKRSQFIKIMKLLERDGWTSTEIKQKIEHPKVFHPQTGEEI